MTTDTIYKSNSNIRRKVTVTFTQPQLDALVQVFSIGEEMGVTQVPPRTMQTAGRAVDLLLAAWEGEEAA